MYHFAGFHWEWFVHLERHSNSIIHTKRLIIMPSRRVMIITHIKIIKIKKIKNARAWSSWHLCQPEWNTALTFTTHTHTQKNSFCAKCKHEHARDRHVCLSWLLAHREQVDGVIFHALLLDGKKIHQISTQCDSHCNPISVTSSFVALDLFFFAHS